MHFRWSSLCARATQLFVSSTEAAGCYQVQRGTEETCSIGDVPLMPRRPTNAHKSRNLNLAINRLPNAVRYFTSTAFRLHTVTTLSTDNASQQRLCSTASHQLTALLYWSLSLWCQWSNNAQLTVGSYVTSLIALSFGHLLKITFLFFQTAHACTCSALQPMTVMRYINVLYHSSVLSACLQCFDTVGWASELYFFKILKHSGILLVDMLCFYKCIIRSVVQYGCVVWHHNLTSAPRVDWKLSRSVLYMSSCTH